MGCALLGLLLAAGLIASAAPAHAAPEGLSAVEHTTTVLVTDVPEGSRVDVTYESPVFSERDCVRPSRVTETLAADGGIRVDLEWRTETSPGCPDSVAVDWRLSFYPGEPLVVEGEELPESIWSVNTVGGTTTASDDRSTCESPLEPIVGSENARRILRLYGGVRCLDYGDVVFAPSPLTFRWGSTAALSDIPEAVAKRLSGLLAR